jgi:hypothetical protein
MNLNLKSLKNISASIINEILEEEYPCIEVEKTKRKNDKPKI